MKRHLLTCACVLLTLLVPSAVVFAQAGKLGQEADKLYETAESQYAGKQYADAIPLFERFVKSYSSHENVPIAYLQLAHCRRAQKDMPGYLAALDEVIRRHFGSAAWYTAYGAKLKYLKSQGKNDEYLTQFEAMVRRLGEAPLELDSKVAVRVGRYLRARYDFDVWRRPLAPTAGMLQPVIKDGGYVLDVVEMADTKDRAQRALRVIMATLRRRAKELPPDWQYAHVELLRRTSSDQQAEKLWNDYLSGWGSDLRAASMWVIRAEQFQKRAGKLRDGVVAAKQEIDAEARKNKVKPKYPSELDARIAQADALDKMSDEAWDRLLKSYAAFGGLYRPMRDRLNYLNRRNRFDDYVKVLRPFLKRFNYKGGWWQTVMSRMVSLAIWSSEDAAGTRAAEALKVLDEFPVTSHRERNRLYLFWRLRLYLKLNQTDQAVKIARTLTSSDHWGAEVWWYFLSLSRRNDAFKPVVEAARKTYGVPVEDPDGKAAGMLKELRQRLRDDQTRHAEEIVEEMYNTHRKDAATIEAVKAMVDYYYGKLLAKPRDKWMSRMIVAYPKHPLTEEVLRTQLNAMRAARRYKRVVSTWETIKARFPGIMNASHGNIRVECYKAANDVEGCERFVWKYWDGEIRSGDEYVMQRVLRITASLHGWDNKFRGDTWMRMKKMVAGTPAELMCARNAWVAYYMGPYYPSHDMRRVHFDLAGPLNAELANQKIDPSVSWRMAYADVNFLAHQENGKGALDAFNAKPKQRKYRDLSLRLDFYRLGVALGKSKMGRRGLALADALKRQCFTSRDRHAVELMKAGIYSGAEQPALAARHLLNVVYSSPRPARMYRIFRMAIGLLRPDPNRYFSEVTRYTNKIAAVQELVPRVLYRAGYRLSGLPNEKAYLARIRSLLASRYPASGARYRLDAHIARRLKERRDRERERREKQNKK